VRRRRAQRSHAPVAGPRAGEEQVRGRLLGRGSPVDQQARRVEVQVVALDARQLLIEDAAHDRVHEAH